MAETIRSPMESEGQGSSSKVWLIVLVIVLVLCCVVVACGAGGYWLWENGDRLIEDLDDWLFLFTYI
jgi:hypothetical protein